MNLAALIVIPLKCGELRSAPDSIHWDIVCVLGHNRCKPAANLSHSSGHVLVVCPRIDCVTENVPERILGIPEIAIVEVAWPDILE